MDNKFRPADLSAGTVALLHDLDAGILPRMLAELVKRRDLDGVESMLSSDTVMSRPWKEIPYQLLPFKDSDNPREKALHDTWMERMGAGDVRKLTARLLDLSAENDRYWDAGTPEEIRRLIRLGADIQSPVGKAGRTPLGEALRSRNMKTTELMVEEFAQLHPGVVPRASKGKDFVTYLILNEFTSFSMEQAIDILAKHIDVSSGECRDAPSRALMKQFPECEKLAGGRDNFERNIIALIKHGILDKQALAFLWTQHVDNEKPGFAPISKERRSPFIFTLARASRGPRKEQLPNAVAALGKFLDAGMDINQRFALDTGAVEHLLKADNPDFLAVALESGVDAASLAAEMKEHPKRFAGTDPGSEAVLTAFIAKHNIHGVIANARRSHSL